MIFRAVQNGVRCSVLVALLGLCLIGPIASAQPETALPVALPPVALLPGALVVSGEGFSLRAFRSGAPAWSNRTYVWENVPESMKEWQFTQLAGGEPAVLSVFAPRESVVTIATTGENQTLLSGWQLVQKAAFGYSDHGHTTLDLYQRKMGTGETLAIPQGGWAGTLVLAPAIRLSPPPGVSLPPGTVVARSPKPATMYLGSPSLAILPGGDYLACHDFFGPGTTYNRTEIFRSADADKGRTWIHQSEVVGAFWSTLFWHRGALYLLGNSQQDGSVVIRRSLDEGRTWTRPDSQGSGLLTVGRDFSNAPTPVVEHAGRLWRGMEVRTPGRTGRSFSALMMSAPADADLLDARFWTLTNGIEFPAGGPGSSWLEGNAVVAPSGQMVDVLRVERTGGETAAVVRVAPDGTRAGFDAAHDFIALPGGSVKFTIRFDEKSGRYWSLVNAQQNPPARRNRLVLISSSDLRNWRIEQELLSHPDRDFHAFQYADWQFAGEDLIFLSRTAWDGAHSFHDANYITFHRILHFRDANLRTLN